MQVVILCGGQGTRIRDVSEDIPKPMIPIGGKPILWHIMNGFAAHGFKDFVLCLGYKSLAIKRFFLDYHLADADFTVNLSDPSHVVMHGSRQRDDWRVTLVETGLNAMTGCRVKRIEKHIKGEHFILTYGDAVSDVDINRLVSFHLSHRKIGTVTAVNQPGRFGELEIDGSTVVEFREKPKFTGGRISGGFFVFRRQLFQHLQDDESLMLEYEPLMGLSGNGELKAYLHDGFWQPMDNARDHKYLNDLWQAGDAPWRLPEPGTIRVAA